MPVEIIAYREDDGSCPFEDWFRRLPPTHSLKMTVGLRRLSEGNTSQLKSLGHGVSEWRIDWGPGLRVYMGSDGPTLVILLGGGDKSRQQRDIGRAIAAWQRYQQEKKAKG